MGTRRITMLVALMAVMMMAVFATAAYAATITGTSANNELNETNQADRIFGKGGKDVLDASLYGHDVDKLWGGTGDDTLRADDHDGADTLVGGEGYDACFGDPTDSFDISCDEVHAT